MVTLALILAAVVVLALLGFVAHQMCNDFSTWTLFTLTGVPQGLCKVLGVLVAAIVESLNE